jgi:ABC-type maltose transport system permease subunit
MGLSMSTNIMRYTENSISWNEISSASVTVAIPGLFPILILFIGFQKYFVEGMTSGTIRLKGA